MGAAYFIVLEQPIVGLDTSMDGKGLAHNVADLDWTAKEIGVRPISEFVTMSPGVAADFAKSEGIDIPEIELPPAEQFLPDDGLKSVRTLLNEIEAWAPGGKDTMAILADLRDCERILRIAADHGVRWHFEVDF